MLTNKPKVLVVDDERSMRLTLAAILEDQGYDVTEVEDGYRAIEVVEQVPFDLVFIDIRMPGINGIETFREIKKISPKTVVVMMTAFSVEDLVKEALDEGAFSVIYKPFDLVSVVKLVESALKSVLILVVEDHSTERETLMQVLTDKGYRVAGAADGGSAIQMVRDNHFDIILMDIKLPGKDGFAVFQKINAIDPDARILFMTGFVLEDSIRQAIDAGAYPVAYKPFDIEKVLALVAQIMAEKV